MTDFTHTHYLEVIGNGYVATEQSSGEKLYFESVDKFIQSEVNDEINNSVHINNQHVDPPKMYEVKVSLKGMNSTNITSIKTGE